MEWELTWNLEDLEMFFCEIFISLTKSKGISAHVLIPIVPFIILTKFVNFGHLSHKLKLKDRVRIQVYLVQDCIKRCDK